MNIIAPEATILWTSIVFILLFVLLRKFAWKPILSAVNTREERIEEALKAAELAEQKVNELKASNEKVLQEAREQKEAILKEAQELKNSIVEEAKESAVAQAEQIISNAQAQTQQQKAAMINEVKEMVTNTALKITEQIISERLTDDAKYNSIIDKELETFNLN